jgi:DNA-binding NtrC family response regulator
MPHTLIVDDDDNFSPALGKIVQKQGFTTDTARTLKDAYPKIEATNPDLIILDMILPDGDGLDLIEKIDRDSRTNIIVTTAHPSVDRAVASLRARVMDFLPKPVDTDRLKSLLQKISERARDNYEDSTWQFQSEGNHASFGFFVGNSKPMQKVYNLIEHAGKSDVNVLLCGESGTGKELAAHAVHHLSKRKDRPFLAVNCGAIPRDLIGSELFGHERGAFTGANRQHQGYFERAHTGTLFLDEITEMPMDMQTNLLRILETKSLRRLGGSTDIKIDVRLITATNRHPEKAVQEGMLRKDLYYRLAIFPIMLPPLRKRKEDIEALTKYFIHILGSDTAKPMTESALELLKEYNWPGNVRELRNAVQRACIMAINDEVIDTHHFNEWLNIGKTGDSFFDDPLDMSIGTTIDDAEKRLIIATLDSYKGNKPKTAETLGISLKTLYNKLKLYNL